MSGNRGFTLIEIMVVTVIVALLAAIAIPNYAEYVKRSRIPQATSELSKLGVAMEQFFQDRRSYPDGCKKPSETLGANDLRIPADTANFVFSCPTLTATTFTILAEGVAGGPMAGFKFTISTGNVRATTGVPSGWTTNANCWVTGKGGACQ